MEDLQRRLDEIKQGIEEVKQINELMNKQANMFEFIDRVNKEVI